MADTKDVTIVGFGESVWHVKDDTGRVYKFDPTRGYEPLGFAADRSYLAHWDSIRVHVSDLRPLESSE